MTKNRVRKLRLDRESLARLDNPAADGPVHAATRPPVCEMTNFITCGIACHP